MASLTSSPRTSPLPCVTPSEIEDADGIDGPHWTPDRVREWIFYGLSILLLHM
jgi:hypothetical protein